MPARPSAAKFHCFCQSCVDEGGTGPDGTPLGKVFPAKEKTAHLTRIAAEASARKEAEAAAEQQTHANLVQDVSSSIFASTLTDAGHDVDTQASRLWMSRNDYQSSSTIPSSPSPGPATVAAHAILEGVRQLRTQTVSQATVADTTPLQDLNPNLPPSSERPVLPFNVLKRERNQLTVKAHKILKTVGLRIQTCLSKLASPDLTSDRLSSLEAEIAQIQKSFDNVKRDVPSVNQQKIVLKPDLDILQRRFSEFRKQNPVVDKEPLHFNTDHHFDLPIDKHPPVAQITMFIAVVCNVIMGVSRRMGDLILGLLTIMLTWSLHDPSGNLDFSGQDIIDQIPVTIETVLKKFNLEGKVTAYAICPECHFTYPPSYLPGSDKPVYPQQCSNNPAPDSTCNAQLLEQNADGSSKPKIYRYPSFHDYLGGLLAHGTLEDAMDRSVDDAMGSIRRQDPPPQVITDILQGDFVRTFEGPEPGKLFIDRPGDEGRYLFVVNVDYFSAEGQTVRGPSASCGLISAACLNLPLDIRYKPENMYVTILPGPKEPSKTELNHYVRPLVDEFLTSWERGVYYSRTAGHSGGRLTRSAIAVSVNDLPAARQVSQCANHNSHHCSRCSCFHRDKWDRTDLSSSDWNPKDVADLRKKAEAWRTAPTAKDQENLFTQYGLRWTELWRLPYWDPTRMLAVDSMHCLLEGLAQYHFREVLGLTETAAKEKEEVIPPFHFEFAKPDNDYVGKNTKNDRKHISAIHALLLAPVGKDGEDDDIHLEALTKRLMSKNQGALYFVMESIHVLPAHQYPRQKSPPAGKPVAYSKAQCAQALTDWRKTHLLRVPVASTNIKVGTSDVLARIREVIRNMDTPSWLRSVPSNFGYAAAGSLKADEWRTMTTVYLPVALVSLWGKGTSHSSSTVASSLRRVLDHTMALVSAVSLACMRTTTESRMVFYRNYVTTWVGNLKEIHPKARNTVNSHMAIHIYDFLRLFGPVRSWWCFPFERLIGQLQRLPSNHKFGELEATMLSSFWKAAKLKHWIARPDCPKFLKECKVVFDKAFSTTLDTDPEDKIAESSFGPIPEALRSLIPGRKAALRARHKFDNTFFSRRSTHVGNSLILFYPAGRHEDPVPGSIEYIIAQPNKPVIYAVRRQLPSPPGTLDPFLPYPHFRACIFSTSLSNELELVRPEWVFTHYARWHLDDVRAVILNLSLD